MKRLISSLALSAIVTTALFAQDDAQTLITKNNCMSCHNIVGMKDAPPFAGIAKRNTRWGGNAKANIINSIKNGSQGKYRMFSNTQMPSFKNLSDKDLDTLANWVLSQSSNMGGRGRMGMMQGQDYNNSNMAMNRGQMGMQMQNQYNQNGRK